VDQKPDVPEVRPPTLDDLRRICSSLEEQGARYVLIGGFAVILHGGERTTKDIDLLVDGGGRFPKSGGRELDGGEWSELPVRALGGGTIFDDGSLSVAFGPSPRLRCKSLKNNDLSNQP
jgi:hypothetical protein